MTDQAAGSPGPATTGDAAPSYGATAPSPPGDPVAGGPAQSPSPPPAGPPPAGDPADPTGPSATDDTPADGFTGQPGARFSSRYGVTRPQQGRYVAGVCAAIGRATNTDPVLWRVVLAVLGFFGGIGILVYVAAWLIIPAEGDTASPIEALLGRGRSSMSPVTVLVLGLFTAVMFAFIVTDVFRAALFGAAILVGGALLVNRNGGPGVRTGPVPAGAAPPAPAAGTGTGPLQPTAGTGTGPLQPTAGTGTGPFPPAAPSTDGAPTLAFAPVTAPLPPVAAPLPPTSNVAGAPPPPPAPPVSGYRPPFAPHGPYANTSGYLPAPAPAAPPAPAPKVKTRRPRSRLGAATFWLTLVAIGLVAVVDLTDAVPVWPSTYFAAVLVTIALGLLVGAWFGRARWLIALGLLASTGLGISATAESSTGVRAGGDVTWRPASLSAMADRYQTSVGDATLDLRQVKFTGQDVQVTVRQEAGSLEVLLPPTVDVTARVGVDAGDALVFGESWDGLGQPTREIIDEGADGPGGGKLRLTIHVNVGEVKVGR